MAESGEYFRLPLAQLTLSGAFAYAHSLGSPFTDTIGNISLRALILFVRASVQDAFIAESFEVPVAYADAGAGEQD
jgi:hypothetical protein